MSQYKVYAAEPYGFPTVPLIVITAYQNSGGYPRAEWFVAIPDDNDSFFAKRISFSSKSFPPGPFQLNEDVVLHEALEQAKQQLRQYLFETRGRGVEDRGFRRTDIHEENRNLFMHYWLCGFCLPQLERIFRTTDFEPLREDLRLVLDLPRPTEIDI